jgi:hypothetical protein
MKKFVYLFTFAAFLPQYAALNAQKPSKVMQKQLSTDVNQAKQELLSFIAQAKVQQLSSEAYQEGMAKIRQKYTDETSRQAGQKIQQDFCSKQQLEAALAARRARTIATTPVQAVKPAVNQKGAQKPRLPRKPSKKNLKVVDALLAAPKCATPTARPITSAKAIIALFNSQNLVPQPSTRK